MTAPVLWLIGLTWVVAVALLPPQPTAGLLVAYYAGALALGALAAGGTMWSTRRGHQSSAATWGGWAWCGALAVGVVLGLVLLPAGDSEASGMEAMWWAGTHVGVWTIGTLTLVSIIHGMMFVAPWPLDRGNGPALQRRRRRIVASVVRAVGVFAAGVGWASVAFIPLFLIPDPSASDYLHWALPASAAVPVGLLIAVAADRIRTPDRWVGRGLTIEDPEDGTS